MIMGDLVGLASHEKTPEAPVGMCKNRHLGEDKYIYLRKGVVAEPQNTQTLAQPQEPLKWQGDLPLLEYWPVSRTVCVGLCRALGWRL